MAFAVVAAFSVVLLGASQQAPLFRAGIDLVTVGVTVSDRRGGLVTGLQVEDFELFEDGQKQRISYFSAGDADAGGSGPPLHLGILLDVSESMGDDVRFTRTAAIKFLNMLSSANDITVVDFDSEVRVARFSQQEFPRVVERIRQQKASGMTALYDAIGVYLDGAAGQDGRKVMLLYTDGGDTRSAIRLKELLDLVKASDVTVYVIAELEHQSSSERAAARLVLSNIAETSGGQVFFPISLKELDDIYQKVVAEVRAQYTVGYVSTNARTDGAWRNVEVKMVRKPGRDYRLRSRKGYFAAYRKTSQ